MSIFYHFLTTANRFLWNGPLLILLLGVHLYFTLRLRFVQKKLPLAVRLSAGDEGKHLFRSLATALAATLGTGNIVGVSAAIALGGPGAVFWCWLTGILGMATAYAESYLSVKYRRTDNDGILRGGIMYIFSHTLGHKKLGILFAFLLLTASFGVGCSTQAGTVSETLHSLAGLTPAVSGILLVFLVGYVILHGSASITRLCSILVPVMAVLYLFSCLILLFFNRFSLFPSLRLILTSAFCPSAATGGLAGGSFLLSARYGIARGLFTNEAGLGTAPLAFVEEKKSSPTKAALLSMSAVFFDTVILCALTGIVIVSSLLRFPELAEGFSSTELTSAAFSLLPGGKLFLGISLIAFAYATLIGWSYFGAQAVTYLFGADSLRTYRICYLGMVFLGSVISLPLIWELTDFINACMVVPNLLALLLLRKEILPPNETTG